MQVLYAFTGGSDGNQPYGGLVRGDGGKLLGTASMGGSTNCPDGCGTVYELTPKPNQSPWTESTLYEFEGITGGAFPPSSLLRDGDSMFGVTEGGGLYDAGTLFRITAH